MPKVASQAASHTICQAVSHMDLLIKGRRRKGEGGEKGRLFIPPPYFTTYFPYFAYQIKSTKTDHEQKDKEALMFLCNLNRAFISKERETSFFLKN